MPTEMLPSSGVTTEAAPPEEVNGIDHNSTAAELAPHENLTSPWKKAAFGGATWNSARHDRGGSAGGTSIAQEIGPGNKQKKKTICTGLKISRHHRRQTRGLSLRPITSSPPR